MSSPKNAMVWLLAHPYSRIFTTFFKTLNCVLNFFCDWLAVGERANRADPGSRRGGWSSDGCSQCQSGGVEGSRVAPMSVCVCWLVCLPSVKSHIYISVSLRDCECNLLQCHSHPLPRVQESVISVLLKVYYYYYYYYFPSLFIYLFIFLCIGAAL